MVVQKYLLWTSVLEDNLGRVFQPVCQEQKAFNGMVWAERAVFANNVFVWKLLFLSCLASEPFVMAERGSEQ